MSKSDIDPRSRITLLHEPFEIRDRVQGAVTDSIKGISYDPVNRPGISNLLTILAGCTGESPEQAAQTYASFSHSAFKKVIVEAVDDILSKPRNEFIRLKGDPAYLDQMAQKGAEKAREQTRPTLNQVRKLIGLVPRK